MYFIFHTSYDHQWNQLSAIVTATMIVVVMMVVMIIMQTTTMMITVLNLFQAFE